MKTRQYRSIPSYTLDKAMKMKLRVKPAKVENTPPPYRKAEKKIVLRTAIIITVLILTTLILILK